MEALEAEMTSDAAKKRDKKIIVRIPSKQLSLLNKNEMLSSPNTIRFYSNYFFQGR